MKCKADNTIIFFFKIHEGHSIRLLATGSHRIALQIWIVALSRFLMGNYTMGGKNYLINKVSDDFLMSKGSKKLRLMKMLILCM